MSPRERDRPQLPWRAPGEGPGTTVLFVFFVLLLIGVGLALYFGVGLFLGR